MYFGGNIRLLRKRRGYSQDVVARELGVTRTSLSGYESGAVQPPLKNLMAISDFFGVTIDKLLRYNLTELSEKQLTELEQGYDIDIKGNKLRVLATTVGADNEENIELVSEKARAGYASGYADPEYISELPVFRLPHLNPSKKYRAFPIQGDSMPPVQPGDIVIGEYVQDWSRIKSGENYIFLTLNDGIVFKKAYPKWEDTQKGMLAISNNPIYDPYFIPVHEIIEVWKYNCHISSDSDTPTGTNLSPNVISELQRQVADLKLRMDGKS